MWKASLLRSISVFLLACASMTPVTALTLEYKLGPEDKVRIQVYEWRVSTGEVYEWSALGGEFTVNAEGMISLPLIGEVPAASFKTEELADEISKRLQAKVGLVERPDASVEIVSFRPFYILGAVSEPGGYPYRPGITILQAVSIAGGYRAIDAGLMRLEREEIGSGGELNLLATEKTELTARRARLQAEMRESETMTFPPELVRQEEIDSIANLLREEKQIFQARQAALRSQVEALEQTKALLQEEEEALRARDAIQERQLTLARSEMEKIRSLVERGLAAAPRLLSLEQTVAQMEAARLDLNLSILRTQLEISKTDRDILALRNQRNNEVLTDLRQTQAKLDEIATKSATVRRLMEETQATAERFDAAQSREDARPKFTIVRQVGDSMQEMIVPETSIVQPGDTIRVRWERTPPLEDRETTSAPQATVMKSLVVRPLD